MKKRITNNQGFAYMLVLIMLAVFVVLGSSVLTMAVGNMKNVVNQEHNLKAYHIAKSGAVALAEYIVANPTTNVNAMVASVGTNSMTVGDGQFDVKVVKNGKDLVLRSKATVNNIEQTVEVVMSDAVEQLSDFTVLALNKISIANHVVVKGKVATNSTNIADVTTQPNATPQANEVLLDAKVPVPIIDVPGSFDQVIATTITSDTNLSASNASGVTNIHLQDGVALSNGRTIYVNGSGVLNLYLENGWSSANHSALEADPNVQVNLYVIDSSDVYIRSYEFDGVIIAPESTVTFHNSSGSSSGGRNFHGTIIANNVLITGTHTTVEADGTDDPDDLTLEPMYMIKQIQ